LLLAIILSFSATKLHAQQNMMKMQEAWKTYLKDSVQLADPMVDSVMAIRQEYRPQMRDIFMDQSISQEDKQTKMKTIRDDMDTRFKAAGITDEQIQKIHDYEDRMRAQMMNRNNGGGQ
ncbi:MAG: hypothetical protein ABI405_02500, partial [Parafilimonas sp.]